MFVKNTIATKDFAFLAKKLFNLVGQQVEELDRKA